MHLGDEVLINELFEILLEYKIKVHIHHFYRVLSKMTKTKLLKFSKMNASQYVIEKKIIQ